MITKDNLNNFSKSWLIDEFTIMREYLQLVFLSYLYREKGSDSVLFKGGTAIRFLFGSFRFSEDLDFSSILSKDGVEKIFNLSIEKIGNELEGLRLDKFQRKANSLISRIKYLSNIIESPIIIHIEISLREKPITHMATPIETPLPVPFFPIVSHLAKEEILAEKIRALSKRQKGRDLFDIWYLLIKGVNLDWDMVEKKMEFYGEGLNWDSLILKIKEFSDKNLKNDIAKFLPQTKREVIINNLKSNVINQLERQNPMRH